LPRPTEEHPEGPVVLEKNNVTREEPLRAKVFMQALSLSIVLTGLSACAPRAAEMPSSARMSPTRGWTLTAPEEQGIDSQALLDGYRGIVEKGVNVHAMLIARNGALVSEAYFHPYTADDMINIHSCTKSILSALVGIAIKEGAIRGVDQKVLDFFPETLLQNLSASKKKITIRHLLTMSAGLAVQHPDTEMKSSPDWIRYVLDLPMAEEPGSRFNYSDATAHLLSAVLQKATGMSAMDYATAKLFRPMGINALWPSDPQGISMGFSEINMTPRDMAKIGLLYLNKGMWDGVQLVPAFWIAVSTTPKIWTGADDYGYLWWTPQGSFQARGLGEQYIVVAPAANVIAVITNGLAQGESVDLGSAASVIKGNTLPANPDAVARLRAMEAELKRPRPGLLSHVSATGARVSGRTFVFGRDANPLNVQTLTVDFLDRNQVTIDGRDFQGHELITVLPADGSFRRDATRANSNDTIFQRGFWKDNATYVVRTEKSQFEELAMTFRGSVVSLRYAVQGTVLFDGLQGTLAP
jgi:CubicO group peptidase (beta-lactamase class C family)